MVCNQKIVYKYNNYAAKKNPYIRMPIKIKIVKLFK